MESRLGFVAATEQMIANAHKWHINPGEMTDAAKELSRELEQAAQNYAQVLDIIGRKMHGEMPLNPALSGILAAASKVMTHVGATLAPWHTSFRKLHPVEVARQESPRSGENMWNAPR